MKTINLTDEQYEILKELCISRQTQDNRSTRYPIWAVETEKERVSKTAEILSENNLFPNFHTSNSFNFLNNISKHMRYMNENELEVWNEIIDNFAKNIKSLNIEKISFDELGIL